MKTFRDLYQDHAGPIHFEDVANKLSSRPDLCAFMMLDKLVESGEDMVSCACHDQIFLSVTPECVDEFMSEDEKMDLIRCGVFFDNESDSLAMFV